MSRAGAPGSTARLLFWDRVAASVISLGGMLVLAAVLGICIYLVSVAAPLFGSGDATEADVVAFVAPEEQRLWSSLGEYGDVMCGVGRDGVFRAWDSTTGAIVLERDVTGGVGVVSVGGHVGEPALALGLADGRAAIVRFEVASRVVSATDAPAGLDQTRIGFGYVPDDGDSASVWTPLSELQVRRTSVDVEEVAMLFEPNGEAVTHIDAVADGRGYQVLAVGRDQRLAVVSPGRGLDAGWNTVEHELDVTRDESPIAAAFVLAGRGGVVLLFEDGIAKRFTAPGRRRGPEPADEIDTGTPVIDATLVAGGKTFAVLSGDGLVTTWFSARTDSENADGRALVLGRTLKTGGTASGIFAIEADRLVGLLKDTGVDLWHTTSGKRVAKIQTDRAVDRVSASVRASHLIAFKGDAATRYEVDPGFSDVSFSVLAGKLRYEEQDEAMYVYQSTSASDTSEAKLSLVPLVFGTVKATVFAMLFAAPIAVLSAIFTSEFMKPRAKRVVKPAVEMMASLPSVVLGFIAAMVVAPAVRDALPSVLLACIVLPVVVLGGAYIKQCLPARLLPRGRTGVAISFGFVMLVGVPTVWLGGGSLERTLFAPDRAELLILAGSSEAVPDESLPSWFEQERERKDEVSLGRLARSEGYRVSGESLLRPVEPEDPETAEAMIESTGIAQGDLRSWLNGVYGGAFPGWIVVLIGPSALVVWIIVGRVVPSIVLSITGRVLWRTPARALCGFAISLVCSVGIGIAAAMLLTSIGLDARDSVLGSYSVRNTLVVGLIMGFAVIPVIYTISEDALSSVPDSLRSASLGAGATQWQTAVRVVLPVAASGIFGAIMIGLGRAVGETMIVLMATGNTPVMDWNIFEGFRTLAANIATELPEAERGGTHYRVLFLCGLTLFAMTFVINTTAELVRQHFRRRNALL